MSAFVSEFKILIIRSGRQGIKKGLGAMRFMQITTLLVLLTISSTTVAANFSVSGLNGSGCENLRGSRVCVTMLLAGDIERGDAARLLDSWFHRINAAL